MAAVPPALTPVAQAAQKSGEGANWSQRAWTRLLGERTPAEAPVVEAPATPPQPRPLLKAADIMLRGDPEVRPLLRKHTKGLAASSALMVFSGMGGILQFKMLGMLVDAAIARDGKQAAVMFASYLAVHLLFVFVDVYKEKKLHWIRLSLAHEVRSALFDRLQRRDDAFFADHAPTEVASRLLNDAFQVNNRNVSARVSLPYHLSMLAMSAGIMIHTSPGLTAAAALVAPIIIWLFLRYGRAQAKNEAAFVAARAAASHAAQTGLAAHGEAARLGEDALRRQAERQYAASETMARRAFDIGRTAANNDYGIGFISHFASHFMVYGLGLLSYIRSGAPSVGSITALAGYADSLRNSAQGLLYIVKDYKAAEGQTRVVLDWLGAPLPQRGPVEPDALKRAGEAVGASVARGRSIALVEKEGGSLDAWSERLMGPGAARLDARSTLLPGTLAENLRDARANATDEELRGALRIAGASFAEDALDLDTAEALRRFGAGAMRRVLLARLLLQDPALIVLSSPDAGLSGADLAEFDAALTRVAAGRAVVSLNPRHGAFDDTVSVSAK